MSRQAYEVEAEHLQFATTQVDYNGSFEIHESGSTNCDHVEPRLPGPIPSLIGIGSVEPVVSQPVATTVHDPEVLEELRVPLQIGFTVLLLVSLPFIAYVLSWRSGFDLTSVTYPLLAALLGGSALAIWIHSRRSGSKSTISERDKWTRILPWSSLQVIPIAGFALWRGTDLARLEALIPLLAITWAFVAIVGLPTMLSVPADY